MTDSGLDDPDVVAYLRDLAPAFFHVQEDGTQTQGIHRFVISHDDVVAGLLQDVIATALDRLRALPGVEAVIHEDRGRVLVAGTISRQDLESVYGRAWAPVISELAQAGS